MLPVSDDRTVACAVWWGCVGLKVCLCGRLPT